MWSTCCVPMTIVQLLSGCLSFLPTFNLLLLVVFVSSCFLFFHYWVVGVLYVLPYVHIPNIFSYFMSFVFIFWMEFSENNLLLSLFYFSFSLLWLVLTGSIQKNLRLSKIMKMLPKFSSRRFIVLVFAFTSMLHPTLVFVYSM